MPKTADYQHELLTATGTIQFRTTIKQVVIWNATASILYLSSEEASATNHEFSVAAGKVAVLPRAVYAKLSWAYAAPPSAKPFARLYAYANAPYTPGITP